MPDEKDKKSKPNEAKEKKGGLSIKLLIVVAGVFIVEAAVLGGAWMMTSKPQVEASTEFDPDPVAKGNRIVELEVLKERFPNTKQGVAYLYETQITVQVKVRNKDLVAQVLEENQARIKMQVGTIIRQSPPRHFDEPRLATLSRQFTQILRDIVGDDPQTNESLVEGVLIPTLTGYRSNF